MAVGSDKIDRVRFEVSEFYYFKGATVSRLKARFGCTIGLKRLLPARGAQAPPIAWLQPREPELRPWSR
jgi:hypothetical protein